MRVLHVVRSVALGGVELRVLTQARPLRAADPSIEHVICALGGGRLLSELELRHDVSPPNHVLVAGGWQESIRRLVQLRRLVDHVSPSIIHSYNLGASFWCRVLPQRAAKVVVHHGGVASMTRPWGLVLEKLLRCRTHWTIYNSNSTRAVIEHFVGHSPSSCVIHNGVAVPIVGPAPTERADSTLRLITVGRLTRIKNVSAQLNATALLRNRGMDVSLTVVGDGPLRQRLESECSELRLGSAVRFLGYRPDVGELLAASDVFVSTSFNETFSMALAEAMARGLRCVAGSVGGPSELLQKTKDGWLVPMTIDLPAAEQQGLPRLVYDASTDQLRSPKNVNPERLADAIEEASRGARRTGGVTCRDRVEREFSIQRYVSSLVDLYRAVDRQGGPQ